jgi:hypothetical protein
MTPPLLTFIRLASYERSVAAAGITDRDERALEQTLMANPEAGDRVQGTGGLMKIRLGLPGRGKRGGSTGTVLPPLCTSGGSIWSTPTRRTTVQI